VALQRNEYDQDFDFEIEQRKQNEIAPRERFMKSF
jgi:hypothetical protein